MEPGPAWPRSRSSPSTAWPSCSAPPGWPGRTAARSRRRSSPPPCGPPWPSDPGVFAPVAGHPATETALVAAYRELRDLSAERPRRLAAAGASGRPTSSACTAAARAALEPSFYDEEDLIDAAAEAVRRRGGPARSAPLVVYLPQRLSRHGRRPARAPSPTTGAVTVVAGDHRRRPGRRRGRRSRSGALGVAGRRRLGTEPARTVDPACGRRSSAGRTRIVTASDADEEVRAAVRAVVDAARAGTRLDRIAILHASPEPYARLASRAADGGRHRRSTGRPWSRWPPGVAGRALLGLLDLPDGGLPARGRLRLAGRGAPSVDGDRPARSPRGNGSPAMPASSPGAATGTAGSTPSPSTSRTTAAALEADPDAPAWRAAAARADAARARALRRFVLALIDDLPPRPAPPRPVGRRTSAGPAVCLDRLLGGEHRRAAGRWPSRRRPSGSSVALDRLACLDARRGAGRASTSSPAPWSSSSTPTSAASGGWARVSWSAPIGMGVGLDLDLVVVLGLAEGCFPSLVHDDSLLPDHEREATGGRTAAAGRRIERQHRQLLAALAGAGAHVLCVPRGDLRRSSRAGRRPAGSSTSPAALAGGRGGPTTCSAPTAPGSTTSPPSTPASAGWPSRPPSRSTGSGRCCSPDAGDRLGARRPGAGRRRREWSPPGAAPRFTRFDGNLAGLAVPSPAEPVTSATRLERWAVCPFAYLMQDVLARRDRREPRGPS